MNAAPEPQEDPDRAAALAVLDDPEFRADLIKLDDLQREYALSRAEWYLRAVSRGSAWAYQLATEML